MSPLKPNATYDEMQAWLAEAQANPFHGPMVSIAPTPQERRRANNENSIESLKLLSEGLAAVAAANRQRAERQQFMDAFTGKPEKSPSEQLADFQKRTRDALARKLK